MIKQGAAGLPPHMSPPKSFTVWLRDMLGLLVVTAVFGVGLWAAYHLWKDFVIEEGRRMSPLQLVMAFLSNGTAVFWFFWYAAGQLVGRRRTWLTTACSLRPVAMTALTILLDVGLSLIALGGEKADFRRATRVEAEIIGVQRDVRDGEASYRVHCHYAIAAGKSAQAVFLVSGREHYGRLLKRLDVAFAEGASPAARPGNVPIRYDPDLPRRAWLEDSGGVHMDSLNAILMLTGIFSLGGMGFVTGMIASLRRLKLQGKPVPWWSEVYKIVPLVFQLALLLLVGAGVFHSRSTWQWVYGGPTGP